MMQKVIFVVAGSIAALMLAVAAAAPADAGSCRIGKPSYCGKYGGFRCRAKNSASDPAAACASWRDACLNCHGEIPACLGDVTIHADAKARCTSCSEVWNKCMNMIDARYYPNRLSQ